MSDLHLGARLRRDVLRHPEALEALLDALDGVDRLVLLGDVVELLEGRPERRWRPPSLCCGQSVRGSARPGGDPRAGQPRRGARAPVVARAGAYSAIDAPVPLDATPLLARVTSWLAPASCASTTRASG